MTEPTITPATRLSPPWAEHAAKISALFGRDPDVGIEYDDAKRAVTLRVAGQRKADAIARLLPADVPFGNEALKIRVLPANAAADAADTLRAAFAGNPALAGVETLPGPLGEPLAFAVFAREAADVPCDNAADPRGIRTLLYEQLARDVMGARAGAFPCTAPEGTR